MYGCSLDHGFRLSPALGYAYPLGGDTKANDFLRSALVFSFDRTASRAGADWDFLKRLRDRWPHKLIIKGVQSPDDARRIAKMGVEAIYILIMGGVN